jgi:hypothetical protein
MRSHYQPNPKNRSQNQLRNSTLMLATSVKCAKYFLCRNPFYKPTIKGTKLKLFILKINFSNFAFREHANDNSTHLTLSTTGLSNNCPIRRVSIHLFTTNFSLTSFTFYREHRKRPHEESLPTKSKKSKPQPTEQFNVDVSNKCDVCEIFFMSQSFLQAHNQRYKTEIIYFKN